MTREKKPNIRQLMHYHYTIQEGGKGPPSGGAIGRQYGKVARIIEWKTHGIMKTENCFDSK
jgi:hypothetical protein